MSQRLLGVLVVLFSTLVAACATTTTHTYRVSPAVPLTEVEMASLTPEEQREINSYRDSFPNPFYFPEAVVYTETTYSKNTTFEAYDKANRKPVAGGGEELPPTEISVKRNSGRTGPHVLWMTESFAMCIPGTKDCSSSFSRTAIVFRQTAVEIARNNIPWQFRESIRVEERPWDVVMMDITKQEINLLIGAAKELRVKGKLNGDCHSVKVDFHTSFRDDPFRGRVVATLTGPDEYYVTYQQAQNLYHELVNYNFALCGCYDNAPNNQKAEAIARGEEILVAVLGPPN